MLTIVVVPVYRSCTNKSGLTFVSPATKFDANDVNATILPSALSTGTQLLFRIVAAAYERRSLAVASHWPFEQWGRFLPEHTTAASILDRLLHHASVVITDGESFRMRHARHKRGGRP